ncbi:Rrf2 family transcriptional regulator, partial [bacterium]
KMLYSRPCEYAIRTMAYLARVSPDKRVQVQEIAASEGIPAPFLAKVLQQLARSNLVNSFKGPGGGFSLNRPPSAINLYEIFRVVDGVEDLDRCAVGLAECNDFAPCPLHDTWKSVRVHLLQYLKKTTLKEMASAVEGKKELVGKGRRQYRKKEMSGV